MTEAYIYDTLRTPRGKGKASGSLYEVKPINLVGTVLNELKDRTDLDTSLVDDVILGCVGAIDDQGFNIAKAGLMYAGWDEQVSGMQINRYCASGLEAVNLAAMKVKAGWDQLLVAGGTESMSRIPIGSDGGPLLHDPEVLNKLNYVPQGVSADLIATIEGFSREDVDHYAFQSQQRAAHAQAEGFFEQSIVPIVDNRGLTILDKDEHIRPTTDLDSLGALRPAFAGIGAMGFDQMAIHKYPNVEKINHVHTAGNSSGIVDGAALVLIGGKEMGERIGLKPRAKILSASNISVEPTIMLTGPAPAAKKALSRAGMEVKDIDLWECNEAFAAVVLKFLNEMRLDHSVVNVNGGAIALGHPLGATGAMLLGTLLDELERRDLQTGGLTLCVGGGMGVGYNIILF
ncbi:MAG: acetyl-CoA C-acetyltransferase [Bacteroidota bacterium]